MAGRRALGLRFVSCAELGTLLGSIQSRQGRGGEAAGLLWAPRLQSQSHRLGTGTHSCPPTATSIPTVGLFN